MERLPESKFPWDDPPEWDPWIVGLFFFVCACSIAVAIWFVWWISNLPGVPE